MRDKSVRPVADEVWIATATLHREHPEAEDFSVHEILARAHALGFTRPSVYAHINAHCVANRPPSPNRLRMLYKTGRDRRRLFRPGDACDAGRLGGRIQPESLDPNWQDLLLWANARPKRSRGPDPLLAIWGTGRDLWADEPADEYVERLRRDW